MRKKSLVAPVLALVLVALVPALADKTGRVKMQKETETAPLVCSMGAMTPAERKQYEVLKTQLRKATKEVKELPNGYAFRYEPDAKLLLAAAEFITKESTCCSFYTFTLEKGGNNSPMWLRITGPKGSKSFIKEALAG